MQLQIFTYNFYLLLFYVHAALTVLTGSKCGARKHCSRHLKPLLPAVVVEGDHRPLRGGGGGGSSRSHDSAVHHLGSRGAPPSVPGEAQGAQVREDDTVRVEEGVRGNAPADQGPLRQAVGSRARGRPILLRRRVGGFELRHCALILVMHNIYKSHDLYI